MNSYKGQPFEHDSRSGLKRVSEWSILPAKLIAFYLTAFSLSLIGGMSAVRSENETRHYSETPIDEFDRDHWSFQPLRQIEVPDQSSAGFGWCRNEIDAFVFRELQTRGLRPQREASHRTLIRRLSFDLTGLPPTPQEIEAFLSDTRVDAYDHLVERLLMSPRYGERWAQHWLDLARFAETDGFEHDKIRPDAWKYRDWVIAAFNEDLPYDDFIARQLAGDELFPGDESALTATRFCLSGPDMPDINSLDERRHTVLNELTSTVGEVFLGLQIGCAQCHDHKYDAISQADFYRFRAIFEPAVTLRKNESLATLDETFPYQKPSHLMLRGDFRRPGPELSPGVIRVVAKDGFQFAPQKKAESAGLRTALAQWLVSRDNPLTSRVIVNRVWQHHFGAGLVDSPSEFGVMGSDPSHPDLLDWLSLRLMDDGWSLRRLHRLIVTSATYRQRSRLPETASVEEKSAWKLSLEKDPQAKFLSRYPRWRLEGEAIRDAMLAVSGELNLTTGGVGVRPPLPSELVGTLLKNQWQVTKDESAHNRRSIYVFARRNLRYPIFEVFDRPSANSSCPARGSSTTALQSLHLLNSEFSLQTSRSVAATVLRNHPTEESRIDAIFQLSLGRPPSDAELSDVQKFFAASPLTSAERLTHLCLSLFNCNEFITID